jgi:hypothetical protein
MTSDSRRHPWRKSIFSMAVDAGGGVPKQILVAGLTDGVFGLDRRKCYDFGERRTGYVVTHLQTGYAVRHLACNLVDAKKAVDVLHGADWDFADPADTPKNPGRLDVVKVVNRMGFAVASSEFEPAQPIEGGEAAA